MSRHVSGPHILFTSVHFAHSAVFSHFTVCPNMCRDILNSFTLVHFANFAHFVHFRVCPDICQGGFLSFTLCTLIHFAHFRPMSGHMSGHLSKMSEVSDMTFSRRDGSLWPQGGGGGLHFTLFYFTSVCSLPSL